MSLTSIIGALACKGADQPEIALQQISDNKSYPGLPALPLINESSINFFPNETQSVNETLETTTQDLG